MSSYENQPQQYNVDPIGQPPPPPPQYAQQPPMQPYGPPPGAPGGGQPPMGPPPGAYVPLPPQPPQPKRTGRIVIASILAFALVAGVGAFLFFNFVWTSGPDPADRFPASATMYAEINLDPSFDQTPKLLSHLSKFEGLDYDEVGDLVADLIEEAGIEGVEPDDINSWLGRRHGVAMWEHDGQPYALVNLASTDADAAERGMKKLHDSAGATDDEFAYRVTDDAVLIVGGESGAAAALDAAVSQADSSALSDSARYSEARSWLKGDQLLTYWFDVDELFDLMGAMGEDVPESIPDAYKGHFIMGVSAFDEGFELTYRMFADAEDPWTGSGSLLDRMGELPAAAVVATGEIPANLAEYTDEWVGALEEEFGGADDYGTDEPVEEPAVEGEPLSDAEYDEYMDLWDRQYDEDFTDEERARYDELDDRYWEYGTEDFPWDGGGGLDDDWGYDAGPDYSAIFDAVDQLVDILAGAQLSLVVDSDGDFTDPAVMFTAHLADGRAAELESLLDELSGGELGELPEGVEVDGDRLSFTHGDFKGGDLSGDARFTEFADAAPDDVALAAWIDLRKIVGDDEFADLGPITVFSFAHGTVDGDGTGLARLYLE